MLSRMVELGNNHAREDGEAYASEPKPDYDYEDDYDYEKKAVD
jgi:hypothetical protein